MRIFSKTPPFVVFLQGLDFFNHEIAQVLLAGISLQEYIFVYYDSEIVYNAIAVLEKDMTGRSFLI